jgi:DNA end-binding protein Ku
MAEVVHLEEVKEDSEAPEATPRTIWSGSLRIGLVNIPVRAVSITRDRHIRFRMLHRDCKTPISFKRYCQEGKEVPLQEIVYGYRLERNKYAILEKKEIDEAKPESSNTIDMDRFVNFFSVDPHYFEKTYVLLPDRSEDAYALLKKILEDTGKAALGRMTMRTKEKVVLVHYYQNALVATTMKYQDEILDPAKFKELENLPEPDEKEMDLARQIVDGLSDDLDLSLYQDEYRERIEALIRSKMGEMMLLPEKKREKPPAKSLMEALRMTAESMK